MPDQTDKAYAPTESADMQTSAPQAPGAPLTNHSGNLAPSNTNSLTAVRASPNGGADLTWVVLGGTAGTRGYSWGTGCTKGVKGALKGHSRVV